MRRGKYFIVFAILLMIIVGVVYFLFKTDRLSFQTDTVILPCKTNADCDDGYTTTADTCQAPGMSDSYCSHKLSAPVSYCSVYNDIQVNYWRDSGLLDRCDIIEGTTTNQALKSELKSKGKIFVRYYRYNDYIKATECARGSDYQLVNKTSCVALIKKQMNDWLATHDGISFDEIVDPPDRSELISAYSMALEQSKKDNPGKLFIAWGVGSAQTPVGIETIQRVLKYVDYYVVSIYESDTESDNQMQTDVRYVLEDLEKLAPGISSKVIVDLANTDLEGYTWDRNPMKDFRVFMDAQFNSIKAVINLNKIAGIGIHTFSYASYESKSWLANLFKHYFDDNKNDRFTSRSSELSYIRNAGFESGSTDWTISAGSGGSVSVSNYLSEFNNLSTKYTRVPEGTKALQFVRGSSANAIKQNLSGLTVGKKYKVEVLSKKISGDYGASNVQSKIVGDSNQAQPLEFYRKFKSYNVGWYSPLVYINQTLATCQGSNAGCSDRANLWNKEEIVFVASSSTKAILISDSIASAGEVSYVDFVQIQEYEASGCGDNVCSLSENDLNICSRDCDRLSMNLSINADRKYARSGSEVVLNVTITNSGTIAGTNVAIAVPIPGSASYIVGSASDGGVINGSSVSWQVQTIAVDQSINRTFKIKIN